MPQISTTTSINCFRVCTVCVYMPVCAFGFVFVCTCVYMPVSMCMCLLVCVHMHTHFAFACACVICRCVRQQNGQNVQQINGGQLFSSPLLSGKREKTGEERERQRREQEKREREKFALLGSMYFQRLCCTSSD